MESVDLSHLSETDLLEFDPTAHPTVTDYDERIRSLRADLNANFRRRTALQKAKAELEEARTAHKLGERAEEDVEDARTAVADAEAAVEPNEPIREAISQLEERREKQLSVVRRAFRAQARVVYGDLMEETAEPVRRLLDLRTRTTALMDAFARAGKHGRADIRRVGESGAAASNSRPRHPVPLPNAHHPLERPILGAHLEKWLRNWRTWKEKNEPGDKPEAVAT
jgi:Fic family protein